MGQYNILPLFLTVVSRFARGVQVVFDEFASGPSIKDYAHPQCVGKAEQVGPDGQVDIHIKNIRPQEPFLANTANKKSFIVLLMHYLQENIIAVHQAPGDADTLIVSVALDCNRQGNRPVAVLAENTDIYALLLYHRSPDMSELYFVSKEGQGWSNGSRVMHEHQFRAVY